MLICPVRDCRLPLVREERRAVCGNRHSFDIARSGYINLLQPQDRRSKLPGDPAGVVAARRRLHDRGVTEPLLQGICEMAAASAGDVLLDAGCGEGFYSGTLASAAGCAAHGVDISIPAVDLAARRYPGCEWIVANADRLLPYQQDSFSLVLSITGRMNAPEFRRVLSEDGRLVIAVPGPEDLVELRGEGRDRVARTLEEFGAEGFQLTAQRRVTSGVELDAEAVHDVLVSIYRPRDLTRVQACRVTFSLDLLCFKTDSPN